MRAVLLILILLVVVLIAGIASGFIDVRQTRPLKTPDLDATRNGVVATGGQTPTFDIETGSVEVGAKNATVPVPSLQIKPGGEDNAAANQAAPANAM